MLTDVERDRYLVFTSGDIRIAHLLQRIFPPAYVLAMRVLDDQLVRTARRAAG